MVKNTTHFAVRLRIAALVGGTDRIDTPVAVATGESTDLGQAPLQVGSA